MLQVFGLSCELVHDSVYKALFSDICLAAEHGSGNGRSMVPVCCQYKPLRVPQVKAPNYRVAERFLDACLPEVCAFPQQLPRLKDSLLVLRVCSRVLSWTSSVVDVNEH